VTAQISQYLDTVARVEPHSESWADAADNPLRIWTGVGRPAAYADHGRLMFDLQVLGCKGTSPDHTFSSPVDQQPTFPK